MNTTITPGLLALAIVIGVLLAVFTRPGRALLVFLTLLALLIAFIHIFIHTRECPYPNAAGCFQPVQPVWAGVCFTSNRAGLVNLDGQYFLTAEPDVRATVTCLDLRFWLEQKK